MSWLRLLGSNTGRTGASLPGFVAHPVEGGEHQALSWAWSASMDFLPVLGWGLVRGLDLEQHLLGRDARRQLGDHQLPLAAGEVFDHPAGAQLGCPAGFIGLADVGGGRDDLAAAG